MTAMVFHFGDGQADGRADMRDLLGGKGANLAEMCNLGLPVPPGFTITTEVCNSWLDNDQRLPDGLEREVSDAIIVLEKATSASFGDARMPLLVSVRSGSRASMPGMMDSVLNLGLNDDTVEGLAEVAGDARFAYDSYRRFIQMYSDVVLGIEHHRFEAILEAHKDSNGRHLDTDLLASDWQEVVQKFKALVLEEIDEPFPQAPSAQLWGAITAVFDSWNNARAITYRRLNDLPDDWGTAVNVQAMVFGNMGNTSATGVAFTRNPATGEKELYGEYLINAQGEDVVAGIRTPQYLTKAARKAFNADEPSLEEAMPEIFSELGGFLQVLETHFRDMQDLEFTVQNGKLWMLQTRTGKRTATAAIRIAVEMADTGLITRTEAVGRIDPMSLDQLLHPAIDPGAEREVLAHGLPASPGAASGRIRLDAARAEEAASSGEAVILVRMETSPEDISGMHAAAGILTARGGMTSHAAVVARGMGRPCVSGAGDLIIDLEKRNVTIGDRVLQEGDAITIDGASGEIMLGEIATVEPKLSEQFSTLMSWADEVRRMEVRTNAETPKDARAALQFGAEGIGLCRTEHMFFDPDRITAVREMILAENSAGRRSALEKILPMQRSDFESLFKIMAGLPVTIRLLDPPLHEFLPHDESEFRALAVDLGISVDAVRRRVERLRETNPMLGHRGCRLGISYPEIYEMQARAILEAASAVNTERDGTACPEIMVPLVAAKAELEIIRAQILSVAAEVAAETGCEVDYTIGTMIELPRAALLAAEISEVAEFFSFGTNDLTQTTLGISRDDAGNFLSTYVDQGIYAKDPFATLDTEGVGQLIRMATERGRAARPGLKIGICGEHGGDPASITFFESIGLDYISCSPYRVPIARLAAAQAALNLHVEEAGK